MDAGLFATGRVVHSFYIDIVSVYSLLAAYVKIEMNLDIHNTCSALTHNSFDGRGIDMYISLCRLDSTYYAHA